MIKTILSLLLLLSASVADATITRVQFATANSGATAQTSLNVTLGAAPTPGNFLVMVVGSGASPRISSVANLSWEQVQTTISTNASIFFGRVGPVAPSATVTVTANSGGISAVCLEYSAINLRPDQNVINAGAGTVASTGTTLTNTNSATELLIGSLCSQVSAATFSAPTNSFTIVAQDKSSIGTGADRSVAALELIVSSTGTYTTSATVASGSWAGTLATFEETPTAGGSKKIPSIGG